MNTMNRWARRAFVCVGLLCGGVAAVAQAQTGVSDDRVSLPEGPGSLEGIGENVDLDPNMGVMRYGVPIELPSGFAGMTPPLRLAYSSGNGGSVVGIGWAMDIPHIERMTYRGLPEYDLEDDFAANGGQQLIRVPGEGTPTYRSRFEKEFVRYRWHNAGSGDEGYWTAEYPDGRVGYFGANADGSVVPESRVSGAEGTFRYMLVEMRDVYDHSVRYTYQTYGNVALVRHIGYVYTTSEDPRYSVSFSYEERMDETGFDYLSDAKAGFDELLTQRLSAINVFSGVERIRRYELSYEPYAESGGFTRLAEVQMLGLEGTPYPALHRFSYSQALGGVCEGDCERPFMVDMGNIGVNIGVGRSTLLDINGDALPDIVDTTDEGGHRFILNVAGEDGSSRFAQTPRISSVGRGSGFRLGTPYVQVLDTNGDGFTDMLHAQTGRVLINKGNGDWEATMDAEGTQGVSSLFGADFDVGEGELRTVRFLDYNNDKKIDVLRSTRTTTSVFENRGAEGFVEDEEVSLLGYGVQADGIQFTDMNGDGLLDPVKLNVGGLRYRLNLGWGRWSEEVEILGLPIGESELEQTTLEDLNGDGLSDLAVVVGSQVKYAINRNGSRFSDITTLTSEVVDGGSIPQRDGTVTVLFADMNGNGSVDVVWLTSQGQVSYLELFPVRPNQMSRIENGLGKVTEITYGTSVSHMARDGGWEAWRYKLPHPMLVVDRVDDYDLLTHVHNITEYRYRDGFYDGIEKQFRGYERVEIHNLGDDFQEPGVTVSAFDVGADDTYRNGLLLRQTVSSADRELIETENRYEDCEVAQAEGETALPIRFICQTGTRTTLKEGADPSRHVVTESSSEYDGYGNVVVSRELGVTSVGGGACAPCERGDEEFGEPCGGACVGDEMFVETSFVEPGQDTSGRWILNSAFRERSYGRPGSPLTTETLTYYDEGDAPFEGMALGTLDQGKVVRVTQKEEVGSDDVVTSVRNAYDEHGNVIETIDPNGAPGGYAHRRLYTLDADKLRVVRTDVMLEDATGSPYRLRREVQYEPVFDKVVESTAWMLVEGGQVLSSRRSTSYLYDQYGRITARLLPGADTLAAPTETYTYELGNPTSRIIVQKRKEVGGPLDMEIVRCVDGKGRTFQSRMRLESGLYQVDGFAIFNTRDAEVRRYQPYHGTSNACDEAPPEGVLFSQSRYDATYRPLEQIAADAPTYGTASVTRTVYEPLATLTYDGEDTDPNSPHVDTPQTTRVDGLGRTVAMERVLAPDEEPARLEARYDGLGRLVGYTDAAGHRKEQTYDLLGRVLRVDDPNSAGPTLMEYDDAGNLVRLEDGRGIVTRSRYDGANRLAERWDEADPEATRITWTLDRAPECDPAVCTNTEGQVAQVRYPGLDGDSPGFDWFGYDARGRPIMTMVTIDDHPFVTETAYDNADRVIATTWPDGRTVEQEYDDATRLTAIKGFADTIRYDARNQRAETVRGDGTATSYGYDAAMRLEELRTMNAGGETLQGFRYARDRLGNILSIDDLAAPAPRRPRYDAAFTYDAWYRPLTAQLADDEEMAYGYDTIDNLTARTSSLGQESEAHVGSLEYDVNAAQQAGDVTLEYDDGGFVTRRGDRTLRWDHLGRLTEVSGGAEGVASRYLYGPAQSRLARREGDSTTLYPSTHFEVRDGITAHYITLGRLRLARVESDSLATALLSDLAPAGAEEDGQINAGDAWLAHASGLGVVELDADGPTPSAPGALLWSSVRRLLVETGPEDGITYLHQDHLGSITLATAGDAVVGQRSFYPMGQVRERHGDVDVYGYTGQEHDQATGLIHFDWRYYDPAVGRWLSIDPLFAVTQPDNLGRTGESTTGYAYVANNFINAIDPTGLNKTKTGKAQTQKKGTKPRPKTQVKGKVQVSSSTGVQASLQATHTRQVSKGTTLQVGAEISGKAGPNGVSGVAKIEATLTKEVGKNGSNIGATLGAGTDKVVPSASATLQRTDSASLVVTASAQGAGVGGSVQAKVARQDQPKVVQAVSDTVHNVSKAAERNCRSCSIWPF